jgi:hypothetical protein
LRSRWAILAATSLLVLIAAPQAIAVAHPVVVAQADQGDSETQGEEVSGEQNGQSDTDAETGTDKKDSEPAEVESGPPWTYQMARIIVVLAILLGLAIFRWYWKLVGSRQRAA